MNTSTRSRLVLVAVVCAAIAGCRNDDVKSENNIPPAPAEAVKASAPQAVSADCSSHEAQIVKLAGELAVSEAKAADLQDRIDELGAPPKVAQAKTKVCQDCPEQEVCPTVAEAPEEPADDRTAAECVALDQKLEVRYRFLSKTVAELEVENYLNEHAITELEKTVGKAKK